MIYMHGPIVRRVVKGVPSTLPSSFGDHFGRDSLKRMTVTDEFASRWDNYKSMTELLDKGIIPEAETINPRRHKARVCGARDVVDMRGHFGTVDAI